MKTIELIPVVDASDFDRKVEKEFEINEISTHYQDDTMILDWEDKEDFPKFKKWLLLEYGEEIKNYDRIAILAT